jgi:hypothetical protein
VIAHIVLFTPKAGLNTEDMRSFAQAILRTCSDIPQVKRAIVGRNADIDAGYARNFGDKTYKYAAVLEFESKDDLVSYLKHPSHQALGRQFWQHCEATVIMEVEFAYASSPDADDLLV